MVFWRRKIIEATVAVLVCVVLLWWNPSHFFSPIRSFLWTLFEPPVLFLSHIVRVTGDTTSSLGRIPVLNAENESLQLQVAELEGRLADIEDVRAENDRLREEIKSSSRLGDHVATALVVGYDTKGIGDWMVIDKGSKDGVERAMTVVFGENNLIGTVDEVLEGTSRVKVISNPSSVFNAHTVKTQAKGVVRGKFGLGIILDSVLQTEVLQEGDAVVTSQLGDIYPPGLFVGKVGEIGVSDDGLFQQTTILLPVDYLSIRVVSIIR